MRGLIRRVGVCGWTRSIRRAGENRLREAGRKADVTRKWSQSIACHKYCFPLAVMCRQGNILRPLPGSGRLLLRQTSTRQSFAGSPTVIQLVTLGTLQLTGDAGSLLAGRRKVLALLACLLRRSPESMRRSELALLLWGDRGESYGKQSLRQALAELRHIFGESLIADAESVLIDPEACKFDVHVFEEAVRAGRLQEAAHLWGGDFLQGLDSVAGEAWVRWLAEERGQLRLAAATVFQSLLDSSERRHDQKAALDWSHRWCEVAPLEEGACKARIGALVRAGRPVDAAVCYEGFVRRLHNETHAGPSAEFEGLKSTFSAGRRATVDTMVVRGTVTLSGLSQLDVDARAVAEAAAVINGQADLATL